MVTNNKKKTLDELPPLPKIPPPMPLATIVDREEKIPEPVSEPGKKEQNMHAATIENNMYIQDAQDALLGIPSELMRGNESVYQVIRKGNRLRGLGVLLVIIALLVAVSGVLR